MEIPKAMSKLQSVTFGMLLDFIMATIGSSQWLWMFIFIYFFCCYTVQRYYMHSMREFVRLTAISNSPVVQSFEEILNGILLGRLFTTQSQLQRSFDHTVDDNFITELS